MLVGTYYGNLKTLNPVSAVMSTVSAHPIYHYVTAIAPINDDILATASNDR